MQIAIGALKVSDGVQVDSFIFPADEEGGSYFSAANPLLINDMVGHRGLVILLGEKAVQPEFITAVFEIPLVIHENVPVTEQCGDFLFG